MRPFAGFIGAGVLSALLAWLPGLSSLESHPNALWQVVHGVCLRDMRLSGRPEPCMAVNRAGGYAVAPDLGHRTQVLLVPLRRLRGIESPELLEPDAPNYWQAAWESRRYVEKRARRPVPRDDIAMAVNSRGARSQNQLHIHVDCVRADVRAALTVHDADIGPEWVLMNLPPFNHAYWVRRVEGAELGDRDPFRLLGQVDAGGDLGRFTLVVVGVAHPNGAPGFALIADNDGRAFGEVLMDHACAVLREP